MLYCSCCGRVTFDFWFLWANVCERRSVGDKSPALFSVGGWTEFPSDARFPLTGVFWMELPNVLNSVLIFLVTIVPKACNVASSLLPTVLISISPILKLRSIRSREYHDKPLLYCSYQMQSVADASPRHPCTIRHTQCNAFMRCCYTQSENPHESQQGHRFCRGASSGWTLVNCRRPYINASLAPSISSRCSTNLRDIAKNTSSTPNA